MRKWDVCDTDKLLVAVNMDVYRRPFPEGLCFEKTGIGRRTRRDPVADAAGYYYGYAIHHLGRIPRR